MRQLRDRGYIVQHHAKDVDGPWPSPRGRDGEWFYHLRPWKTLEWVDIWCEEHQGKPYTVPVRMSEEEIEEIAGEIQAWLRAHNIPFSIEEGVTRVWGYIRPRNAGVMLME